MRGEIALDTNIVVDIFGGNKAFQKKTDEYEAICLPVPVVGELLYGALISNRTQENINGIKEFVSRSTVLSCDHRTAELYGQIRAKLKKIGKPIPETDLWIGACCMRYGVALATKDSHFDCLEGLTAEKW